MKRDRFLVFSVAGLLALIVVSAIHLRPDLSALWQPRARSQLGHLLSQALPMHFDRNAFGKLAGATVATLAMAIVASTLAWTGAFGIAFLAAGGRGHPAAAAGLGAPHKGSRRNWGLQRGIAQLFRWVLLFCRAVPPPVWALLFVFVIFPGPLPGALALAVYNFGVLGRLMAEVIDNLDDKPVAALRTQGISRAKAFLYSTVPLTIPRLLSLGLYRWEVTIREVVVVGLVGAGGLGRLLGEQLAAFNYSSVTLTILALVSLTLFADLAGGYVRRLVR